MKTIIVTGACGFLGRAICNQLALNHRVIGFGRNMMPEYGELDTFFQGDITVQSDIESVCRQYCPDVVVHCAGIAHEKLNSPLKYDDYKLVNHLAVKQMALSASRINPAVHFIFLSSISVYGEKHETIPIKEIDKCLPTSLYAVSKLDAEKSLERIYRDSLIKKVDVLRLAPVYDIHRSLNLDKRVTAFKNKFYVKFGSGGQKMSALSRNNLADFIDFGIKNRVEDKFYHILNLCDEESYSFNEIIDIFKLSQNRPDRLTVKVPLSLVRSIVGVLAKVGKNKSITISSFYDKLANDLVFDNSRMIDTGFSPKHSLASVFLGENGNVLSKE